MNRNKWKWKHDNPKSMGFSKSSAKKEVHSNASIPQDKRNIKEPNFTPKASRQRRTEEPQS